LPTREIIEKLAECRKEMENIEVKGYKAEYYYRRLEDMLEDCCENDRLPFPLIDPNRIDVGNIKNYLGSERFLGTAVYMWKEMRKDD